MEKVILKFWVTSGPLLIKNSKLVNLTLKVVSAHEILNRSKPFVFPVSEPEFSPNGYEGTWEGFGMPVKSYEIVEELTDKNWKDDFDLREEGAKYMGKEYIYLKVLHDCRDVCMEIAEIINED